MELRVRRIDNQEAELHETPGAASGVGANRILKQSRGKRVFTGREFWRRRGLSRPLEAPPERVAGW